MTTTACTSKIRSDRSRDPDLEKALATRFKVVGYPTMIVLDSSGKELGRAVGYQSSKQLLTLLNATR